MNYLAKMNCFMFGHGEIEVQEWRVEVDRLGSYVVKDMGCARCGDFIFEMDHVEPPEDEPHRTEISERLNLFDKTSLWNAYCWCGWKSQYWRDFRDMALADAEVHKESNGQESR